MTPPDRATLHAIIVPTSEDVGDLRNAIDLAARLGCPLVALCSRLASASRARELGAERGIELLAMDIARVPSALMPDFATHQLLVRAKLVHQRDTSVKRNLGLLLARSAGWQRVFFLDDDIDVPDPDDMERAARLLDEYDAVGLRINDFPDNSVVCHVNRDTGGAQATFIGGGALAVSTKSIPSFFPNIYNEDWFFLLDGDLLRPTALIGAARQEPYDPYDPAVKPFRASAEEFGDSLADGVFWLLEQGRSVRDATEDYWRDFLRRRRTFIRELIDRVDTAVLSADAAKRIREALDAALRRHQQITPDLCVQYLGAWKADYGTWRKHVEELEGRRPIATEPGVTKLWRAVSRLGLESACHYTERRG